MGGSSLLFARIPTEEPELPLGPCAPDPAAPTVAVVDALGTLTLHSLDGESSKNSPAVTSFALVRRAAGGGAPVLARKPWSAFAWAPLLPGGFLLAQADSPKLLYSRIPGPGEVSAPVYLVGSHAGPRLINHMLRVLFDTKASESMKVIFVFTFNSRQSGINSALYPQRNNPAVQLS